MEKKFKLGVIGAGFMSTAIVNGVIASSILAPSEIIVSDLSENLLLKMKDKGVNVTFDNKEVACQSEFVLFAIKPQNLDEVLLGIKDCECEKLISIMAGVKKAKIKKFFTNALVARCMPNTPCSIGYGAVGLDVSDYVCEKDIAFIKNLFNSLADVVIVDEEELNAVTGISGSSPAYFYLFLRGVINAGVKHGLNYEKAKTLACATMIGAGNMVKVNPDKTLEELINAVCSKGGTTIEAVKVFEQENLDKLIESAVTACINRSFELENL